MAQFQVFAHGAASQVEIAVFHAQLITTVCFVLDGERRSDTLAEHIQLRNKYLDVTCRHLWVFALPLAHESSHLYAIFTSEFVGLGA